MKLIVVLLTFLCLCQCRRRQRKPQTNYGCPKDFLRFEGSDRCFYISTNTTTFDLAKKHCESLNSQLAPVLTCSAQVDLSLLLAPIRWKCLEKKECMEFWIDVYRTDEDNAWKSASMNIEARYQSWAAFFPQQNGSCAFMSFYDYVKRGTWRNDNCTRQLKYVCVACPNDFAYMPEVNECLQLILDKKKWKDAQLACTKLKSGAQLVTIKSEKKMSAVGRFLMSKYKPVGKPLFIGCSLPNQVGPLIQNVIWIGGQTQNPKRCDTPFEWKPLGLDASDFTYTNWDTGYPSCNPSNSFCVRMSDGGVYPHPWTNVPCNLALCSVCEFL